MTNRLRSLDVFRGASVALMILVNNPGTWAHLYPPLAHAAWHGVTPTDLVFPFFLFAVGNALALVLPRLAVAPAAAFWWKVARRTAAIFAIGLLLNISPFVRFGPDGELVWRSLDTLRVMGVLQRIALCFGAAAVITWWLRHQPPRALLAAATVLLVGYWLACVALGESGTPGGVYSLEGFFGTHWDRAWLGSAHLYRGEGVPFDPEGLASTVPAVAQVLLGVWAGRCVVDAGPQPGPGLVARLFVAASALLVLAYLWQLQMPLNKKIWTSSYVLLTTGLAMMALAWLLHGLEGRTDTTTVPGWARFFEVFGKNPLFIFVLSGLVPRFLGLLRWPDGVNAEGTPQWLSPLPWAYRQLFAPLGEVFTADPRLGSLLFAVANLLIYGALAAWLNQQRIYFRV